MKFRDVQANICGEDPAKLVPMLGKLRKLLAAEQQRLAAVLAKNEAHRKTSAD